MTQTIETSEGGAELKCPDCQAVLKQRRSRKADACEMLCGGCGQVFDVCDLDTAVKLKGG
jgi:hypothetical protein